MRSRQRARARKTFALPTGRRPYPGLEALNELDAALLLRARCRCLSCARHFAGNPLYRSQAALCVTWRERCWQVIANAGRHLARLNRDDRNFIALPTVRPSNAILSGKEGLWQALETALADQRRMRHLRSTTPRTRAAIRLAAESDTNALAVLFSELKQAAQQSFIDKGATAPSIVLAIDQGEELFNPEGATEAEIFLRLLSPVWESDQQFIALIAIRSDVYPQLQAERRIDQQQVRPFNLAPCRPPAYCRLSRGRRTELGWKLIQRLPPPFYATRRRGSVAASCLHIRAPL